uniref:Uncharacterized protein n=1 Tax=Attheya septentrionalis TaxID=420275 RepID=A0A7S2UHB5_9STRA
MTTYTVEGSVRRHRTIDMKRQIVKEYEASGFKNERQFLKFWNRDKTDDDEDYLCYQTLRRWVKRLGTCTSETKLMDRDETEPLVSRGICEEWTDVNGCNKVSYGTITKFEEKDEDEVKNIVFTVKYMDESRALMSTIPEFRKLKSELAWGGCVKFEREQKTSDTLEKLAEHRTCSHWITPIMRNEELDDRSLPQLTLVIRGFKLVFSVRDSTIPNAGKGVFVKGSNIFVSDGMKSSPFVLNKGELLDLGIYAPFRAEDKKEEHVFFMKNFIHSFICEEWTFNTDHSDTVFDITDDWTGEIHDLARQHVPAYINECSSSETPTIRAEHDPEGNVHYLLGIVDADAEKLTIPVDGTELELFINYGPLYENVRLRKLYSELPLDEKKQRLKKLEDEDNEYLGEIDDFSGETVADCVAFIEKLVSSETQSLSRTVKQRSLRILRLLVKKAKTLLDEDADQEGLKTVIVMAESLCIELAMDCVWNTVA